VRHNLPPLLTAYHAHGRYELTARCESVTLPITHDPEDAPRIGDDYEGRTIVDRAFSDDEATLTLWFEEAP
jgi:hypothetical protein